ncbi:hypothetical protein HYX13_05485 [Candidatus Woesearchaeota archaeon]|nr:hypothetical protein [Candidatus Woesearchaeota archaeon]
MEETKKILLTMFLIVTILLVSCQKEDRVILQKQTPSQPSVAPLISHPENLSDPPEQVAIPSEQVSIEKCTFTADCPAGKECINSFCMTLEDISNIQNAIVSSSCKKSCQVQKIHLKTSDGEEYTLAPGQGSYSYAGALEWKILSLSSHCQEINALIPFKFISKNTGKIIGEEIVTVAVGQKSKIVTHPTIKRVAFTVEVIDVEEKCV